MTFTLLQALWSIVVLVTFVGIVLWANSGKRRSAFDEAGRLPFDDELPVDNSRPSLPKENSRSR